MNPFADVTDSDPSPDEPCEHIADPSPQVELFTDEIVIVCVKCGERMGNECKS